MKVQEFRNIKEVNNYVKDKIDFIEIIPLSRTFEHPETKLLISSVIYIVIEHE